jgi:BirA family transcriptional regulator, biotin operon repressor / biotin---[acetyl-CoA-carboxylase] ligase
MSHTRSTGIRNASTTTSILGSSRASSASTDLAGAADAVADRGGELGRPLTVLASTTSTNDEAKREAARGAPHGATWIAEQQTAGRGRQGRAWWAAAGEGLLFTVLLRQGLVASRLPQVALIGGLAVLAAVKRAAPEADVKIKWPNDVVVGQKKVGGVLVEAVTTGSRVDSLMVGFGINVHTRNFPEELADRAISIALLARVPPSRSQVLADVLGSLDADLPLLATRGLGPIRARLEAADALRGSRVRNDGGDCGVASGIDNDGRLLVRREDGDLVAWVSGEVHLVR